MADYFIDLSASTNGSGTLASPFNTFNLVSGNRYWVRRVKEAAAKTVEFTPPNNVFIIGWPKPGDRYYAERPASLAWDTDNENYVVLRRCSTNQRTAYLDGKANIYISRFRFDIEGNSVRSGYIALGINNSSRIKVEHCYLQRVNPDYVQDDARYHGLLKITDSYSIQVSDTIAYRNLLFCGPGSTINTLYINNSQVCSIHLTALTDSNSANIFSPWRNWTENDRQEVSIYSTVNCAIQVTYDYQGTTLPDHAGYYLSDNLNSRICLDYKSPVNPETFVLHALVRILGDNRSCYINAKLPQLLALQVNSDNSNTILIETTAITGNTNPSYLTGSVTINGFANVHLKALTASGIAFPVVLQSKSVSLDVIAHCYIDKVNGNISASLPDHLPATLQYYDANNVFRALAYGYQARSVSIAPVDGSDRVLEVTATVAKATSYLLLGVEDNPIAKHTISAGQRRARFQIAATGTPLRLRPGHLIVKARVKNSIEPALLTTTKLTMAPKTWLGLSDYRTAYLDLLLDLPETSTVEFGFECLFGTYQFEKLYIDLTPEITPL